MFRHDTGIHPATLTAAENTFGRLHATLTAIPAPFDTPAAMMRTGSRPSERTATIAASTYAMSFTRRVLAGSQQRLLVFHDRLGSGLPDSQSTATPAAGPRTWSCERSRMFSIVPRLPWNITTSGAAGSVTRCSSVGRSAKSGRATHSSARGEAVVLGRAVVGTGSMVPFGTLAPPVPGAAVVGIVGSGPTASRLGAQASTSGPNIAAEATNRQRRFIVASPGACSHRWACERG